MTKPNENYVCARWRDAITDPPDLFRHVPAITRAGVLVSSCVYNNDTLPMWTHNAIQWLDITNIPAVPRAAVQAAVDEMRGQPPFGCDTWQVAMDILQAHCGVAVVSSEESHE